MKYLPLIWAGLWRKPARTILTLLSVTVAFTLFGLMIGLNASFQYIVDTARLDRIYVNPRFGMSLPLSERQQITRLDGVTNIGYFGFLPGYYQDPKNFAGAIMIDPEILHVWPELPVTPQQYDRLKATPAGIYISRFIANRFGRKTGDILPIQTTQPSRDDGAKLWPFNILGVLDDIPNFPAGFILGNYAYYDQARLMKDRGTVSGFTVLVKDPDQATGMSHTIDRLFANSSAPTRSIPGKIAAQNGTQSIVDVGFVTKSVAAAGLFMILFLTGNGMAQSVRERIPEFAVMKTLGFSNFGVTVLVFVEAAIPCLSGAALGLFLATIIAPQASSLVPPGWGIPLPRMSLAVLGAAFACAAFVALVCAIIPALRLNRLDLAAALSGR